MVNKLAWFFKNIRSILGGIVLLCMAFVLSVFIWAMFDASPEDPAIERRSLQIAREAFHPSEAYLLRRRSSETWLYSGACTGDALNKNKRGLLLNVDLLAEELKTERWHFDFCVDLRDGSLLPDSSDSLLIVEKTSSSHSTDGTSMPVTAAGLLDPKSTEQYRRGWCFSHFEPQISQLVQVVERSSPNVNSSLETKTDAETSSPDFRCELQINRPPLAALRFFISPNSTVEPITPLTVDSCRALDIAGIPRKQIVPQSCDQMQRTYEDLDATKAWLEGRGPKPQQGVNPTDSSNHSDRSADGRSQ